MAIRNYIGGTIEKPCTSTGIFAWSTRNCSTRDYRSWKLAARDMWRDGIEPTWKAYADAAISEDSEWQQADDPLWQSVEIWRAAYNMLPDVSFWASPGDREFQITLVLSLMVSGETLVGLMQAGIESLGFEPPTLPEAPPIDFGTGANLPVAPRDPASPWPAPWIWWVAGGAVLLTVIGVTVSVNAPKRRGG